MSSKLTEKDIDASEEQKQMEAKNESQALFFQENLPTFGQIQKAFTEFERRKKGLLNENAKRGCYYEPMVLPGDAVDPTAASGESLDSASCSLSSEFEGFPGKGGDLVDFPTFRSEKNPHPIAAYFLEVWMFQNRYRPYATKQQKLKLSSGLKMEYTHICNWFTTARRRLLPEFIKGDGVSPSSQAVELCRKEARVGTLSYRKKKLTPLKAVQKKASRALIPIPDIVVELLSDAAPAKIQPCKIKTPPGVSEPMGLNKFIESLNVKGDLFDYAIAAVKSFTKEIKKVKPPVGNPGWRINHTGVAPLYRKFTKKELDEGKKAMADAEKCWHEMVKILGKTPPPPKYGSATTANKSADKPPQSLMQFVLSVVGSGKNPLKPSTKAYVAMQKAPMVPNPRSATPKEPTSMDIFSQILTVFKDKSFQSWDKPPAHLYAQHPALPVARRAFKRCGSSPLDLWENVSFPDEYNDAAYPIDDMEVDLFLSEDPSKKSLQDQSASGDSQNVDGVIPMEEE